VLGVVEERGLGLALGPELLLAVALWAVAAAWARAWAGVVEAVALCTLCHNDGSTSPFFPCSKGHHLGNQNVLLGQEPASAPASQ